MEYRDDRDALRDRADSLEGDLEAARTELDAVKHDGARLEKLERDLAAARAELDALRGRRGGARPRGRQRQVVAVAAGAVAFLMGILGLLVVRTGGARKAAVDAAARAEASALADRDDESARRRQAPAPATTTPAPPPGRAAATPPRSLSARWGGSVKRATGADLLPGTPCSVTASLASSATRASISVDEVTVVCGAVPLFRSSDKLSGMSTQSSSAEESTGPTAGTYRYALSYEDQGARTGPRTQLSLSTPARTATVWSESGQVFRVELAVDELSPSAAAAPLVAEHANRTLLCPALARAATVETATGNRGVAPGSACAVSTWPVFRKEGDGWCHVRVECGKTLLYGSGTGGFAPLTADSTHIVDDAESAKDGDPRLDLDLAADRVVVDDTGLTTWRVALKLAPPR